MPTEKRVRGPETGDRDFKCTIIIEREIHSWLWRERRRRERPIAWIVNQALKQYRKQFEEHDNPPSAGVGRPQV